MTAVRDMFARHPLVRGSLHASCEEGWLPLIDDCLTELEAFGLPIVIHRIREKMGALRINILTPTSVGGEDQRRWEDIIRAAEESSLKTCEICGKAGWLRQSTTGTYATRCDQHQAI
ncbi:hypothetical protein C3Y89_24175 [Rhizobium sp. UPM1132]|uniref:hypothetical protein n=1 Tax=Rhizobium ruizarguesonis TaxID=2081791 RepID=UPI001447B35B|nr:hypothetical protein [Rhizobium ruizarguesonis]NKQ73405.1 hypothetical protein [Rhizobium ruizarguesonis]